MLRKCFGSADCILQMDIEGAEYETLLCLDPELLRKFRIIVIEFHCLDGLFDSLGFELIKSTFDRLLRDFVVVHIHPNNCLPVVRCDGVEVAPVMEFTFLRRDRISKRFRRTDFPHLLDRKCVQNRPDVVLPHGWY